MQELTVLPRLRAIATSPQPGRLRVLHILPYYQPAFRYGGPVFSVHSLARAQAARGHDVHVFTTDFDGPERLQVPLAQPVDLDGVRVTYFAGGKPRRLFYSPGMAATLRRSVASFDILHLHTTWLWPTTYAAHVARARSVPYVLAPRGMLVAEMIRRKNSLVKRAWLALFERRNVERASAVHVTSALEEADLRELGLAPRRLTILPNGIDTPSIPPRGFSGEAAPVSSRCRPTVLALGRIHWKKGLDRLIRALPHVPEADLLIAGNDEDGQIAKLRSLAAECGVSSRVAFAGPVYDDRKWSLLASAALLALPSYSENFGNVVLEAMAVGCPVIVTPEVGAASIVQRSGAGIVVSGDPEHLGRAISELLSDGARRADMSAKGRAVVVSKFGWSGIAERCEQLYLDCLAPPDKASA